MPFDGDVIVIVDPAEVRQTEVTCQRGGLATHALHHAAVAGKRIDVESKEREIRLVVARSQPVAGQGHADAGRNSLAERPCRRLHSRGPSIFGMSRDTGFPVAESSSDHQG